MSEQKRKAENELILFNEEAIRHYIQNGYRMFEAAELFNQTHDMEGLRLSLGRIGDQMRAIKAMIGEIESLQKKEPEQKRNRTGG